MKTLIRSIRLTQIPRFLLSRQARLLKLATCAFLLASYVPSYAMQVDVSTEVQGEFRPTIKGSCNLPDGMTLVVRITRKESAFQSETAVEVQSSHFEVGPLSQASADLNPGLYNLEIVSVHPTDQPEGVIEVIGRKGEQLQGPLTRRSRGVTSVRLVTTFQIGQAANPELDKATREQVMLSQTKWWRKNCADICSGAERYSQQKGNPFDRPACMKTCITNPPSITR